MRRRIVVLASLLVLTAVLAACSGSKRSAETIPVAPKGKGPEITVDKESLDFGKVRFLQMVEPAFRISNVGDADLHVTRVSVTVLAGC
ncbi:MAG: hypothetical protein HY677_01830 [Chloroflexi bacterium]|nr:hypothetical protein [Chloroflexota bacterium]